MCEPYNMCCRVSMQTDLMVHDLIGGGARANMKIKQIYWMWGETQLFGIQNTFFTKQVETSSLLDRMNTTDKSFNREHFQEP